MLFFSPVHDLVGDRMLHDFAANTGEQNEPEVLSLILLSFPEGRGDVSGAPIIRDLSCCQ